MAVTTLLGLPIPQMSDTVGKTIPDLASAMQMIDEKLGGSRIVDHNLDVTNPENGYYWRTEDGLQVCWYHNKRVADLNIAPGYSGKIGDYPYPAAFISPPAGGGSGFATTGTGDVTGIPIQVRCWDLSWLDTRLRNTTSGITISEVRNLSLFAIGRWK